MKNSTKYWSIKNFNYIYIYIHNNFKYLFLFYKYSYYKPLLYTLKAQIPNKLKDNSIIILHTIQYLKYPTPLSRSTKHFQTDIHHREINLTKDPAIFFLYPLRASITAPQKSARGIRVEESCRPVRHALLPCFESSKNERRTTTNHDRDASLFATVRRPVCGASSAESVQQGSAPRS